MSDAVSYAVRDGVAWVTLNRPAVLNALDLDVAATLADHAETAASDAGVWLVIVRGAGRAFCSGMDRTALARRAIDEAFYRHWIRALNCLEDMPKITVAVLHGYSIGGGLQLAVACDLRLATTDAVIGLGATRHGLIPDGSVLRLARLIGLGRAKELTLLNDHVTAEEARAIGLVNWVCPPDGVDAALAAVIDKARTASPTAAAHAKHLLHESFHRDPRAMIEDVVRAQNDCMASWEIEEANRAWQDKREAVFHPTPPPRTAGRPSAKAPGMRSDG
jgi:enoyl-CoA hydratase/carnithine racemase